MYSELINYISNTFLKHKVVKCVKYQNKTLINQQNNNRYIQVVIENQGVYAQWIKTANVFTITFNINILAFPKDENDILDKQTVCFQVGNEVLNKIENDYDYKGLVSIYDYDFLSLSHFSNDSSCGWRLSLELVIPAPINLCDLEENFDDEIEVEEQEELNLVNPNPESEADNLILKPIKLNRNGK